jgi:hypothetical protein
MMCSSGVTIVIYQLRFTEQFTGLLRDAFPDA